METLITGLQVLALFALASIAAVAVIAAICWVGGREIEKQLDPDSDLNYGRRHNDRHIQCVASPEYGRRTEDETRANYLLECD